MLSSSNLIIVALWVISIGTSLFGPSQIPLDPQALIMPLMMATLVLLMPIVFFGAVSFFGPAQSPFYHPQLARFINTKYGEQAYESFLVRLKPILLFGVASMLQGAMGLWRSYESDGPQEAYVLNGLYVSGGLAFALAHGTFYVRKAVGVFPTWTMEFPTHASTVSTKLTLHEALRTYWWTLSGIVVFPSIFMVGGTFLHIPFEFFILPFFAVGFLAGWPHLSGKAPYSFWMVAMGLWLVGGICAIILMQLIHMLLE